MKFCNQCETEKPFSEFYKDSRTKSDGLYGHCKKCHNRASTTWQKKNPEPGRIRARKWHLDNPGKKLERTRIYRLDPEFRKRENQWNANYKLNNKDKVNSVNAGRRASKQQATPSWLTLEMQRDIDFLYTIRGEMKEPKNWHVDHYYPLNGVNAKGLHVPWNLRLYPASDNVKKKNKLPEPLKPSIY